jgi:hypothetical protein
MMIAPFLAVLSRWLYTLLKKGRGVGTLGDGGLLYMELPDDRDRLVGTINNPKIERIG